MGERTKNKTRDERKREKRRIKGNRSKKEGNYPYFVSLFHTGPYMTAKNRDEFQKISRGLERFL